MTRRGLFFLVYLQLGGQLQAAGVGIEAIALPTEIFTGLTVAAMFAGSICEYVIPDDSAYGPA